VVHTNDVGLIGLGRMGSQAVERLLPHRGVVVWDLSQDALLRAKERGARLAGDPAELARQTSTVLLFVPSPSDVESLLAGESSLLDGAPSGYVVVDMTTGEPGASERFHRMAGERGAHYLDAPVLGRPEKCGEWTLPVGGDPAILAQVESVLSILARNVTHVGGSGSGMTVKLLNNLMFAAINAISAEVASLGDILGVGRERLFDVILASEAATVSPLLRSLVPKMVARSYEPIFTLELLAKDLRLAMQMCEERHLETVVPRALKTAVDLALAQGYGDQDSASLFEMYRRLHGARRH